MKIKTECVYCGDKLTCKQSNLKKGKTGEPCCKKCKDEEGN